MKHNKEGWLERRAGRYQDTKQDKDTKLSGATHPAHGRFNSKTIIYASNQGQRGQSEQEHLHVSNDMFVWGVWEQQKIAQGIFWLGNNSTIHHSTPPTTSALTSATDLLA